MKWLSVAEISKITMIPAPTARRYASLFKEYLSSRKMGRVTKYPESAVEIFKRIVNLYNEGLVTTEIEEKLRAEYPRTIEVSATERTVATQPSNMMQAELSGAFSEMMAHMTKSLEVVADQKSIIEEQREDIYKLKKAFVLLARSQKKIKALPQLDMSAIAGEYDERASALEQKDIELEEVTTELSQDNSALRGKIEIMEAELMRLRKDRRDMENYFLDKIKRLKS
ncbi:MAG: hypothetical protein BA863_15580 [Desulfovibrio sp. S3730MH75]|nr:MAG: hypothetical protein BA863_15580 [Desulfovibrio sp. S3730MH75]